MEAEVYDARFSGLSTNLLILRAFKVCMSIVINSFPFSVSAD